MSHLVLGVNGQIKEAAEVDRNVTLYLEEMFYEGEDVSTAQYVVASLLYHVPSLKPPQMSLLPRAKQSLKGWRKISPARSRLPAPWEVVCLLGRHAVRLGLVHFYLHMMVMFALYLRPSETLRLRVKDLVKPVRTRGSSYRWWSFVLHPLERGVPSKTQEFDETLDLDLGYHQNLGQAIDRFCKTNNRAMTDQIFSHSLTELNQFLLEAGQLLQLEPI